MTISPSHVAAENSSQTTVLAAVTSGIEPFIQKHGVEPSAVLSAAKLAPGLAAQPSSPMHFRDFCRLLEEAVHQTGNDLFGLHFGHESGPELLGFLGYMGASSATLGEALAAMEEFFPVHQSNTLFQIRNCGGVCRLEYHLLDGSIVDRRQDSEASLAILLNFLRQAGGGKWSPLEVHFEHPRPSSMAEHYRIFGSELVFGQESNAILFAPEALERPMSRPDPYLHALMRQSLALVASKQSSPLRMADLVAGEIIKILPAGEPKLKDIAERTRLSSWTLQRRLSNEGTKFSELVDSVRKGMAATLIAQRHTPISDLAFQLGYSETSSFSRAFVRWFGVSPRQWRRSASHSLPRRFHFA